MSAHLGLIISEPCQFREEMADTPEKEAATAYGPVGWREFGPWLVICRSFQGGRYHLPHEYQSAANLSALKEMGVTEVVGVHSSGSLRPSLAPGTLVVPDDWINFTSPNPTTLSGRRRHLTPGFSRRVRQKLADAAWQTEAHFENGGTYWQSRGPRLETRAEIKVMSNFADLVGMGLADEAGLAQELDLEYGALCSVDNYANGLGFSQLTDEMILQQLAKSSPAVIRLLDRYSELS